MFHFDVILTQMMKLWKMHILIYVVQVQYELEVNLRLLQLLFTCMLIHLVHNLVDTHFYKPLQINNTLLNSYHIKYKHWMMCMSNNLLGMLNIFLKWYLDTMNSNILKHRIFHLNKLEFLLRFDRMCMCKSL